VILNEFFIGAEGNFENLTNQIEDKKIY